MFIKILEKLQYVVYVGIIVQMVYKLVNSMKKTFGSGKDQRSGRMVSRGHSAMMSVDSAG
jgi:hypothetical protein